MIKLLWSIGAILIFASGIYWTFKLKGIQFSFINMFKSFKSNGKGISPFKSLTMALAARIGVGSLAGIALAIYLGGYGTIFWMWVTAILSSTNAFCEVVLGMIYQKKDEKDVCIGGPSFYIEKGLRKPKLAFLYALIILLAYIVGFLTIQANTITVSITEIVKISPIIIGVVIALISLYSIIGGVKKIADITAILVPIMAIFYLGIGLFIMITNLDGVIQVLGKIITDAFNIKSFGFGVITSLVIGIQRGIFSNEAGLGTGAIASATVKDSTPIKQGFTGITGIYITSLLVGTITAIVIMLANIDYSNLVNINGIEITSMAFVYHLGNIGKYIVMVTIILFAFSTIITGYYYGEASLKFMFPNINHKKIFILKIITVILLIIGSIVSPTILWNIVDIFVIFMALINIPVLFLLRNDIMYEYNLYKQKKL